jgi:hypothetical protein
MIYDELLWKILWYDPGILRQLGIGTMANRVTSSLQTIEPSALCSTPLRPGDSQVKARVARWRCGWFRPFFYHTEYACTLKNIYECAHASISACICACIVCTYMFNHAYHIYITLNYVFLCVLCISLIHGTASALFARSRPLVRFWPHKSRWHLVSFRRWSYLCQRHLFARDISWYLLISLWFVEGLQPVKICQGNSRRFSRLESLMLMMW